MKDEKLKMIQYIDFQSAPSHLGTWKIKTLEVEYAKLLYIEENRFLPFPKECYSKDQALYIVKIKALEKPYIGEMYFTSENSATTAFASAIQDVYMNKSFKEMIYRISTSTCADMREEEGCKVFEFYSINEETSSEVFLLLNRHQGKNTSILPFIDDEETALPQKIMNPNFDPSKLDMLERPLQATNIEKLKYGNLKGVLFNLIEENQYSESLMDCYPKDYQLFRIMLFNSDSNAVIKTTIFYFDSEKLANDVYGFILSCLIDVDFGLDLYKYLTLHIGGKNCYEAFQHQIDEQIFVYCFTGDEMSIQKVFPQIIGKGIELSQYLE